MTVYIDNDYKCHTAAGENLRAVESTFFDGKCQKFIEGYRYIPAGESWTRSDGVTFTGPMASPWKPSEVLAAYQEQYEQSMAEITELRMALDTIYSGEVGA